ncbi:MULTISPECIES: hypothetical protein [Cupriavidus]|nr:MULTISPECIES: hypothetical protein [Cupriavidus]
MSDIQDPDTRHARNNRTLLFATVTLVATLAAANLARYLLG